MAARDPERLAQFWAELLGTSVRGRWEQYVFLAPLGDGPSLTFQGVDERPVRGGGAHLDLYIADRAEGHAVVQRATALGAEVVGHVRESGAQWVLLEDPEGNPFCVVPLG